jgi:hypothetical protein
MPSGLECCTGSRECNTRGHESLWCLIREHFARGRECCIGACRQWPVAPAGAGMERRPPTLSPTATRRMGHPSDFLASWRSSGQGKRPQVAAFRGEKNFLSPYFQNTKPSEVYCQIWRGILAWKSFCISDCYFRQGERGWTGFPQKGLQLDKPQTWAQSDKRFISCLRECAGPLRSTDMSRCRFVRR